MAALYFDRDVSPESAPANRTQALNPQNLPTSGKFFEGMAALQIPDSKIHPIFSSMP
jgi:hypothetical protein